jgi:hypothetical protein
MYRRTLDIFGRLRAFPAGDRGPIGYGLCIFDQGTGGNIESSRAIPTNFRPLLGWAGYLAITFVFRPLKYHQLAMHKSIFDRRRIALIQPEC